MNQYRCKKCNQLQFKWKLEGDIIRIEIKCYACNTFNYFIVNLSSLLKTSRPNIESATPGVEKVE